MADQSLGDFFNKKGKKKIKGSNLNTAPSTTTDGKAQVKKDASEEDGWQEEQVSAPTITVQGPGLYMHEEERKDVEIASAPAWGNARGGKSQRAEVLSDRKYPTLQSSTKSSNINLDDGRNAKINIETTTNVFSALETGHASDDEEDDQRPQEIKPAMIQKKKGEYAKDVLAREVQRYTGKSGGPCARIAESESDEDEEERKEQKKVDVKKKKKTEVKKTVEAVDAATNEEELAEDLKITKDLDGAKAKYNGRRKPFAPKKLPQSEINDERENKRLACQPKKKKIMMEETLEKTIAYAPF